jgi:hypothetical protein
MGIGRPFSPSSEERRASPPIYTSIPSPSRVRCSRVTWRTWDLGVAAAACGEAQTERHSPISDVAAIDEAGKVRA